MLGIDDALLGGIIGGAGSLLGGLFGASAQDRATEQQMRMMQQMKAELDAIPLPELKAAKLEEYKQTGLLTPQMEQVINAGPSALEDITVDPRLRNAQYKALDELSNISDAGYTVEEQAAMQKILDQVNAQEQGQRGALMQNMQSRGLSGSGIELANNLSNIQGGSDRAAEQGLNVAANAQARKMAALGQLANLGAGMEKTQWGEQSDVANAKDLINKFNIQNQIGTQQRNVASGNAAQQYNLGNAQQLSNANTDIRNTMAQQPNALAQQKYNNQIAKYGQQAGVNQGISNLYGQQGQNQASAALGIGRGIGTAANAIGSYYAEAPLRDAKVKYYNNAANQNYTNANKKNPYTFIDESMDFGGY
jgi:hypothetical protein